MRRYGLLSPASQDRFLARQETGRLVRYPDDITRKAINWSNLLADALSFAHSAYEGDVQPQPSEPSRSQPGTAERVAEAQPRRNPELERRLARTIGPVQNYEDSF
jgi:hypothetical protein